MPVGQIKFFAGNSIMQDEPGQKTEIRKELCCLISGGHGDIPAGHFFRKVLAMACTAVFAAVAETLFAVVVVSVKHIKPVLIVELFQKAEDVTVDVYDAGEGTVFP